MRHILRSASVWFALLPAMASAQVYLPSNVGLPPQSVIGNALPNQGDAVAVPFAQLKASLGVPQAQSCSSHNWLSSISALGVFGCTQPNITDIAGLGSGAAAALAVNVGNAASVVVNGGSLGTPSSGSAANLTNTAPGLGSNNVARANEAQGVARSVIGVAGNATANVADIQGTSANTFLGINAAGTGLAFSVPALANSQSSLGADVAMNNTANYFPGPSIAQGTSGTWYACGQLTVTDTAGSGNINAKLWDGTTVINTAQASIFAANNFSVISICGVIANPAGNIRLDGQDVTSVSGVIKFNRSGLSKDSTVSAIRIN